MNIKKFATEEEAKANLTVSNNGISHVGDEYWICDKNILNTTIEAGINHVCDFFKIRVPLGIEWQVGEDWRIMSLIDLLVYPSLNSFSNILNLENELWRDIESHKRLIPSFKFG